MIFDSGINSLYHTGRNLADCVLRRFSIPKSHILLPVRYSFFIPDDSIQPIVCGDRVKEKQKTIVLIGRGNAYV